MSGGYEVAWSLQIESYTDFNNDKPYGGSYFFNSKVHKNEINNAYVSACSWLLREVFREESFDAAD